MTDPSKPTRKPRKSRATAVRAEGAPRVGRAPGPMPPEKAAAMVEKLQSQKSKADALARYLKALRARDDLTSKGGDNRTLEQLEAALEEVAFSLRMGILTPLAEVEAEQRRLNLIRTIQARKDLQERGDPSKFEEGFVAHVKDYSNRKGITRAAWRKFGVPAEVLDRGGL